MIGSWNSIVKTRLNKMKFIFRIKKGKEYSLFIESEPMKFDINFTYIEINGNEMIAKGVSCLFEGKIIEVKLIFEESTFKGSIILPNLGELQLEGVKGEGNPLYEELIENIKEYRKINVQKRTDEEIKKEVEKIISKMTLNDKMGQMSQCVASVHSFGNTIQVDTPEKLVEDGKVGLILGAFDMEKVFELQTIAVEKSPFKIPLLFNADVIHGYQTIFPVPLAWSCSWNLEAIKKACAIAAKEASASGVSYNHGPMVDITRDPRWGRVVEGAGEDTYLGSRISEAQVAGFQGNDLFNKESIIACLKHFIAYGASEAGRDYNSVDISERALREFYLPPFKAGVDAGAGSVMNSFNTYNGVPIAGNKEILKDLLRDELGFEGMTISDYGSIHELVVHGVAKDDKEAVEKSVNASLDIEMVSRSYYENIPDLIKEGKIKEEQIDESVRRILIYKYKIGLMDDPFRYIRPDEALEINFSKEHLEHSRELAKKSIVLLKNNGILPLSKSQSKIAIIGPFADSKDLLGAWQFTNFATETVTIADGMKNKVTNIENIIIQKGCKVEEEFDGGIENAVKQAENAEVVILTLGEESEMSGEAASKTKIRIPDVQIKLAKAILKLGKPTVLVLTNGRPLILDWFEENMDAIVETWFLGSQAGNAIADVLFGDYNPSGKLTMSFPRTEGQIPVYYNHFKTGRPVEQRKGKYASKYLDCSNYPLYPFGYGLSYTNFEYSEITLSNKKMNARNSIEAKVTVKNIGNFAGEEIVQFYIQDLYGSVVRPVKELKGFKNILLKPNEEKEVTFWITEDDLKYHTADLEYKAEPGEFKCYIGTSSIEVKEVDFELINSF